MSATDAPRVLMLGAGAVGMSYGYHLEQGGASVTYFVKPKYQEKRIKSIKLNQSNLVLLLEIVCKLHHLLHELRLIKYKHLPS